MTGPKILFWDIETSPIITATWSLFQDSNSHDNILEDWKIISAAWKWEDSDEVKTISWKAAKDKNESPILSKDDSNVIRKLHNILSQADILVAHNGDQFDWKKFQTRCIELGLSPLPPKQTIDTLKVARKEFKFTSNRMDYIGGFLKVGRKTETPKGLHISVIKNEKGALDKMIEYNKGDVILLEAIYNKLKPYIRNHPNYNLYIDDERPCCTRCGSARITKSGYKTTRQGKKQRYNCLECGSWSVGATVQTTKIGSA